MPPWLPEPGYGEFANERRLSDAEIALLHQWLDQGSPEGNPSDLPPTPAFPGDWILGKPDLVVQMPASFQLQSHGQDVYRNFVIPVALTTNRYVKAVELRPGHVDAHDGLLLTLHYRAGVTPGELAAEHAEYQRRYAAPLKSLRAPTS